MRPDTEDEALVDYVTQVSGGGAPKNVTLYMQNSYSFDGLLAETEYTVAVRLTDRNTGNKGLFGEATTFTTLSCAPSKPRNVQAEFINVDQRLRVFWVPPAQPNGIIRRYEVLWSGTSGSSSDCDKPEGTAFSAFQNDLQFNTTNTGNINGSSSAIVCVRAHTAHHPGDWESVNLVNFTTSPFSQECDEEYTAFIVAVAIAGASTLMNLIMGILLALVIHQRWSLTRCLSRWDKKESQNGRPTFDAQNSVTSRTFLVEKQHSRVNGDYECEKR